MNTYILATVVSAAVLLVAAFISNAIKYEGGANPKDPLRRRVWFWVLAVVNPIVLFVLAMYVLAPTNRAKLIEWNESLPYALGVGVLVYIMVGFGVSKVFRNGKLGNWF
jgi:sulfoxide reductase heme-binding subunit YedZ